MSANKKKKQPEKKFLCHHDTGLPIEAANYDQGCRICYALEMVTNLELRVFENKIAIGDDITDEKLGHLNPYLSLMAELAIKADNSKSSKNRKFNITDSAGDLDEKLEATNIVDAYKEAMDFLHLSEVYVGEDHGA